MPKATVAPGIELEYETFGDPSAEPLLLVMGLGTQLTGWPVPFCEAIAESGFHVVRFDNRDIGLSTQIDAPVPDFGALLAGDASGVPYGIPDMAADTVGLLDALGIGSAHIVGASMGGMIAQQVAIDFPDRVRSLCSIMSTTGSPAVGQPSPEALGLVLAPRPDGREAAIDRTQALFGIIGSPDFPTPPDEVRQRIGDAYDRAYAPEGTTRQIAAIASAPDRTADLGKVEVPATVIHGDQDKLVDVSGGYATAAALGIEPMILKGAGHDLPAQLWDVYVGAIVKNARRAAAE